MFRELKRAGLSNSDVFYELIAVVGVVAVPIILLLIGAGIY